LGAMPQQRENEKTLSKKKKAETLGLRKGGGMGPRGGDEVSVILGWRGSEEEG